MTQFGLGSLALGLGCVINGQGIMQSDVVHKHAQIPNNEAIMICIAMGNLRGRVALIKGASHHFSKL